MGEILNTAHNHLSSWRIDPQRMINDLHGCSVVSEHRWRESIICLDEGVVLVKINFTKNKLKPT
ncbi:9542_t:CDS:2 [Funneliformis geosporum]|nr:9542_t:CDS:2 [Funneliformis geosporum]